MYERDTRNEGRYRPSEPISPQRDGRRTVRFDLPEGRRHPRRTYGDEEWVRDRNGRNWEPYDRSEEAFDSEEELSWRFGGRRVVCYGRQVDGARDGRGRGEYTIRITKRAH